MSSVQRPPLTDRRQDLLPLWEIISDVNHNIEINKSRIRTRCYMLIIRWNYFYFSKFLFEGRILVYSYKILVIVWISTLMFFWFCSFIINETSCITLLREKILVLSIKYESPDLIFRCFECFLLGVDWFIRRMSSCTVLKRDFFFSTKILLCPLIISINIPFSSPVSPLDCFHISNTYLCVCKTKERKNL